MRSWARTGDNLSARRRYEAALADVLDKMQRSYLAAPSPAPHPNRLKRWLRRPYRRVDFARYIEEMRR